MTEQSGKKGKDVRRPSLGVIGKIEAFVEGKKKKLPPDDTTSAWLNILDKTLEDMPTPINDLMVRKELEPEFIKVPFEVPMSYKIEEINNSFNREVVNAEMVSIPLTEYALRLRINPDQVAELGFRKFKEMLLEEFAEGFARLILAGKIEGENIRKGMVPFLADLTSDD